MNDSLIEEGSICEGLKVFNASASSLLYSQTIGDVVQCILRHAAIGVGDYEASVVETLTLTMVVERCLPMKCARDQASVLGSPLASFLGRTFVRLCFNEHGVAKSCVGIDGGRGFSLNHHRGALTRLIGIRL